MLGDDKAVNPLRQDKSRAHESRVGTALDEGFFTHLAWMEHAFGKVEPGQ